MAIFHKAVIFSALTLSLSLAEAANFNCRSLTGQTGGQVRLTVSDSTTPATFALVKNNVVVGRVDFSAPPSVVRLPNLNGEKVSFLKYFDSFQTPNIVVTSLMYVEASLLQTKASSGLLTFQQQKLEKYLCQPATN
jgi:hypothetical protein